MTAQAVGAAHTGAADAGGDTSAWPLLPSERTWSAWQLMVALVVSATATWCYVIGDFVAQYLGFVQAFFTLTAGCLIGMLIVALAAGPVSLRFGVDSIATVVPQFGTKGWRLASAIQFVSIVGWNSLLMIFFGKSMSQLLIALGVVSPSAAPVVLPVSIGLACALVFVLLLRGASGVGLISKVLSVHVLIGIWVLYTLLSHRWPELAAAAPVQGSASKLRNFTTGIEVGIVTSFAWWPYLGSMVRMAPSARQAAVPVMLGMGAPVPLLSMIGVAGSLILQNSDPSIWLRQVGGPSYGILALAFVAAANFGTAMAGSYAAALGLRHYPGLDRAPWPTLVGIAIVPVMAIGFVMPELFFAHFGTFIAFIGVTIAPLCGIQIADYFVLRRRRVSLRALYDPSPEGEYYYWRGVNPVALVSMVCGFALYVYLLDPLTYRSHWPFEFMTASVPTVVASGTLYWLLSKLFLCNPGPRPR